MTNLFKNNIFYDYQEKEYKIDREIDFFDENEFRKKTVEELVDEWYEIFKYKELPIVDFKNVYVNDEPIVGRTQTSINIYIPLNGECETLCYEPHNQALCCSNYYAEIDFDNNCLLMQLNFTNKTNIEIDDLIESTIVSRRKNIETQYEYLKKDVELYNHRIKCYLKRKFEDLYQKVQIKIEIEQKTKKSKYLKLKPKNVSPIKLEEKTIETNNEIKNIVDNKIEKVIALEKESYLQIYNNLKELSIYARRLPKSYNKLSEEENRDQLVNALNLKLTTATATGETFNVKGKCDIIIIDNKVIYYIGECKIWNGKTKFGDAIKQLLSYISQDVFYSSLIIFNKKDKSITSDTIEVIKSHPNFVEQINEDRFKFVHPCNDKYELEISVIVFDVCYKDN